MPSVASSSSSSSSSDSEDDSSVLLASTLTSLNSSLSGLESSFIAPLLAAGPLKDTLAALAGGELDRAKLEVTLSYMICDLVWIYLRTKGINPEDHAVLPELKRVQTYFNKIQQAEFPEKRKFQVDRPAAARFIKSALASNSLPSSASESDIGMQTRFNILKHQEATLHDSSSDDDSEPETTGTKTVFGADGKKVESKVAKHLLSGASAGTPKGNGKGKGKGKGKADLKVVVGEGVQVVDGGAQERAVEGSPMVTGVAGKKRSRVDPFAGFDSPSSSRAGSPAGSPAPSAVTPTSSKKARTKGKGGKK